METGLCNKLKKDPARPSFPSNNLPSDLGECDLNTVTELYKHLIKINMDLVFCFWHFFPLAPESVLGEIGSWSPSPHAQLTPCWIFLLSWPGSGRFRDGQAIAKPTLPQGFCLSRAEYGTTSRLMLLSPPRNSCRLTAKLGDKPWLYPRTFQLQNS